VNDPTYVQMVNIKIEQKIGWVEKVIGESSGYSDWKRRVYAALGAGEIPGGVEIPPDCDFAQSKIVRFCELIAHVCQGQERPDEVIE
jgi:hypothetical protein